MYCIPSIFQDGKDPQPKPFSKIVYYTNDQQVDRAPVLLETHAISIVQEGEKRVEWSGSSTTVNNRAMVLMKMGRCLMTERSTGGQAYSSLLIFFDHAFLEAFVQRHGFTLSDSFLKQDFQALPKDDMLQSIVDSIHAYLKHQEGILKASLQALKTEELLLHIVQAHGMQALSFLLKGTTAQRDLAFKRAMEHHAGSSVNIEQLAFLYNMSSSTFRRRFIHLYGTPPGEWFKERRLLEAAHRMRSTGAKPSEVYHDAGYGSLSSFIQAFKKQFGVPPAQYAQN